MPDRLSPPAAAAPPAPADRAAALAHALAKAARALTLYDPGNALVRQFLADVRTRAADATAHGPLVLDVLPFELASAGAVVYRDPDRERSLALRLYRDGVRRLTLAQGVLAADVFRLVEILAAQLAHVRQAEDDVVTMIRSAELSTVALVAVEGYAPEEEAGGMGDAARDRRAGVAARPPPSLDRPVPRLPPPGPLAPSAVPEDALAALRTAEGPDALPAQAVSLVGELVAHAARGAMPPPEVAGVVADVRAFLASQRRLEELAALADLARAQPAGPLRDALLRALADPRLVDALLDAMPPGATALTAAAERLLPLVPAAAVLDRLAAEADPARRTTLVALAAARLPVDADVVLARLPGLPAEAAPRLAQAIAARAPALSDAAAEALLGHADAAVQAAGLRALASAEARVSPAPVVRLLHAGAEAVRIAAAQALERHGDAATARAVAEALTDRTDYSRAEAEALGRALGRLHPGIADRLFDEWLPRRGGLLAALRRGGGHAALLRWAAVAGLGVIEGAEAERRIAEVATQADDDLRRHCHATLARRRAEERRRG